MHGLKKEVLSHLESDRKKWQQLADLARKEEREDGELIQKIFIEWD